MRTSREILEQIEKALDVDEHPGESYEEGVLATLRWIMDEEDDPPPMGED